MTRSLSLLFRESLAPILAVLIMIFVLLLYVQYKSTIDADRVTLIEIEHSAPTLNLEGPADGAGAELNTFYTARSDDPTHLEAEKLVKAGRLIEAETLYKRRLAEKITSETLNDLGLLYYKMGDAEKALAQLDQASNTPPVFSSVYFNRGVIHSSIKQYAKAAQDYQRLLQINPNHFEAQYNLGVSYLRQKDYPNAISAFEKAASLAGGSRKARALYNMGIAYRAADENSHHLARRAFEAAIRIKPDYLEARIGLVTIEPDTPQGHAKALAELEKILSIKPSYSRAYFQRALIYSRQGHAAKAANNYLKAIQFDPEYSKARYNYGLLMLESGKLAKAREQFEWILKRNPNHTRSLFNLGRTAYAQKDYDAALKHYYDVIYLMRGDYPQAYLNVGLTHAARGEAEAAIYAYQEATRLRQNYPEAWYNLGLIYLHEKAYDKAVKAFHSALKYDRQYAQAWFNIGVIYARQNKNELAIEAYQNALAIRPDYQIATLNLAIRYARKKRYGDAIELYRSVLEQDDSYASAWYNIGLAYRETKDHENAAAAFRKLLTLEPDSMKAHRALARVMIAQKNYEEAIKLLQKAVDIEPANYRLHMELSRALRKAGHKKAARKAHRKAKILKQDLQSDATTPTQIERDTINEIIS